MIDVIITSYKEPRATVKAMRAILENYSGKDLHLTLVDPFPETEIYIKKEIKDPRWSFFLDSGEGKAYALNLLFQEKGSSNLKDLFVLTDGDVFLEKGALKNIVSFFKDPQIGCVTGHPIPLEDRSTRYGYWAHMFMDGIDTVRRRLSEKKVFFECSGYLFAIRKGIILDFPTETSEDSIIPYLIWRKGYRIAYAPEAHVYVKNPSNWKDWVGQKVRNIKAHERLDALAPDMPRTKSLWNEIKWGSVFALSYPRNFREYIWTAESFIARLYIYSKAYLELKKGKNYNDGWRGEITTSSTSPLNETS